MSGIPPVTILDLGHAIFLMRIKRRWLKKHPLANICWNQGRCCGWNFVQGRAVRFCMYVLYIHSQLSHLPSTSINQPFLPYVLTGYKPGLQGIFIKKSFIGLFSYDCLPQLPPSSLPPKFASRKKKLRRNGKGNMALLRLTNNLSSSNQKRPNTVW